MPLSLKVALTIEALVGIWLVFAIPVLLPVFACFVVGPTIWLMAPHSDDGAAPR